MKRGKFIIGLTLSLAIGLGATAYAATGNNNASPQRMGLGRIISISGYDSLVSVLKNKLGLTDTDITDARNSGKSIYDVAQEKGLTADQLKSALYEERAKAIDDAVSKGTITKEQGESLKTNLKSNIDNCTGAFGQGQCTGRGRGMMGGSQRGLKCPFNNNIQ